MSDKSFGDCTNRNVVKNPLLSTAVTGLSIEDLTHNAVLLPAVPSQELITIQDQQNEAQNITLRHLDHDITNFPSGDAASYQTQFKSPLHVTKSLLDNQKQTQYIKNNDNSITTKSKASLKTDDDFDVNEYFARLQGTRYVSAPLNSHLKEDQNANLPPEENLEEINLNEPEKKQNQDDFQNSLTADIAQNFSQLPSVLPQVASAVFSSFSNMLNLKSREQTPDEVKMYQHAQFPEMPVPSAAPEPPAVVMPPPLKEPPISGNTSNYRITTKKKVYAQIPGLSSGDNQIQTYNTTPVGQVPYYFTPEPTIPENRQEGFHTGLDQSQSLQDLDRIQVKSIQGTEETFDAFNKKTAELSRHELSQPESIGDHEFKITNPVNESYQETIKREIRDTKVDENITQTEVETIRSNMSTTNQNREEAYIPDSIFSSVRNNEIPSSIGKSQVDLYHSSNQFVPISQVSTSIIPPPPMFSSVPRKDSQTTDKSILPPSVARRIGSNQPVIKSFTTSNPIIQENIFTPNILPEQCPSGMNTNLQQHDQQNPVHNITISPNKNECDTKISSTDYFGSSSSITSGFHPFVQNVTSQNILNESIIAPSKTTDLSSITRPQKDLSKAEKEKENRMPISNIYQSPYDNNKYPSKIEDNNIAHQVMLESNIAPSIFFNPANITQSNIGASIADDQSQFAGQKKGPQFFTNDFASEPPKGVPEPPKVSSNLNYRMTKKRPQYYSGPIEGLGSISNNIKPTINPVQPDAYHGALFNPDPIQSGHKLPVVYDTPNRQESLAPFDIIRPINLPTESTNDSYITQQITQTDFNTAFDLSRPTTERHEQTQPQESKGFGIIGSLKSKFSSIDINKIQNTVTTFFDPTYNDPKTDAHREKESNFQTFSGNYQNFPQHEDATLEVFVPNVEQTGYQAANPYNYQMQTLQTYQNQQYYPNQEYFNQSHNYSKDYYSGYHENLNKPVTGANISNVVEESRSGNDNIKTQSTNVEQRFDVASSCTQADTASILEVKPKTINNITQITNKTESVFDDFTLTVGAKRDENDLNFLNPIADSDKQQKIVETKMTDSFLGKCYGPSKTDIQSKIILFKEINTVDIHSNIKERDTPNNDIIHQLQSVADSTLKNVFDCKSPIVVESVLAKDIQEPFPIISNVAIDPSFTPFFDYQKPIFAIPDNNIKQSIIDHPVNIDSSHTFFDFQAPISNPLPRNEEDCNILNSATTQNATIGKTLEMLSGPTDFNSLCPLLQSKSENLQSNASAVFAEKNTLNETPLFSLFEQPSLLPPLPSFDLSKISAISLPVPIKESTEIKNLETKMDNVTLYDNTENVIKFERKSSFFDKTLPVEDDTIYVDNQVSDLNICETCREVNKPEEKEADLTTQLIENITAPIQLANPVEFPVIASTSVPDISDFSNQFAEISYIPEDIIETMKQPPSVELKEDNFNSAITFGWSTGDSQTAKAPTDHDYNFQTDSNVIGFFDDKSLFFENVPTNASDEIKAEYKISQEDTIVLPRQLSIPTAPPEEDSNSDESGLDVHSIEQDAKNDFPIYEEFVIEPSETDDDKIEFKERERYSEDSPQEVDTFTNRVERFKQMETSTDLPEVNELQKTTNALSLATSSSPAITIASYFDTGNYAVENHYKNSLTSPPCVSFGVNISSSTSIPPGFEEEYKRKCSGISSKDIPIGLNVENIPFIPDTTTQTPVTVCLTFTQPSNTMPTNVVTTDISTRTTNFVPETVLNKTERLPAFSSIIKPKSETVEQEDKPSLVQNTATETKHVNDTLSDSINFFSSNEESNVNSDVYNNFSRLSSYFTTPPKPEHSKSFFELSLSQNHYRHKPDQFNSIQSQVKDFFDSSDLTKTEASDIPQNYLASMNLVRDLASHKTVAPKEDIVKIVNYFTVSYDIDNRNIGEPKSSIDITEKSVDKNTDGLNELGDIDDAHFCINDLLKQCSYCYDTIKKIDVQSADSAYKVKSCMDNTEHKNGETNMSAKQENVKKTVTVNFYDSTFENTIEKIAVTSESRNSSDYAPVKHHWFYRVDYDGKSIWRGFSAADSRALENAFISPDLDETTVVATDGGRFDVNVVGRIRIPVYWTDKPSNVMRCSWFYKGNIDARYVPYAESDAEQLEEEYRHGVTTGEWHRRLMLPNHEMVVMHGPAVMVHFLQSSPTDGFGSASLFTFGKRVYRNPPKINVSGDLPNQIDHLILLVHGAGEYRHQKEKLQSTMRPRVVRRGCVESEIEDTEPSSIDHLLLLCHGVGSACDMRFRSVEEVVDDFRTTSLQLIQSHYKNSYDSGVIGRVEVLPISWHSSLHSGETGVDRRLAAITLESIPRLRNFTNDTILDVLFYTSPVYCQTIVNTVCTELNRIYNLFKTRNPDFKGGVSLGGHSLGSVILYDLLCHQMPESNKLASPSKQYVSGTAGTGQPTVMYPGLVFQPDALYALGSPIAIFECIRGVETLGQEFCLPTCKNFFNIFHPYDPIAYRLEPMINPLLRDVKPSLIPHHKGRKRMHLELKDTMARVGADIKQKLIESIRSTWSSMWRTSPPPEQQLEKVVEEIEKEELTADTKEEHSQYEATPDTLGRLNNGRRIDHVLQEAPFEIFNEYLFAMTSHVCYWESEDTMLVMLREIYNSLGVSPDCSLPQHTMTLERSRLLEDPENPTSPGDFPSTSRGTS